MMPATNVHIINHTHWDREWFLTSVYTSRWIPGLIDKLEQLTAENPDFRFLFDGQTLVIEDLLAIAPDYAGRTRKLISDGRLLIGPYYCQPDWQMTGGELLIRNLAIGQQDTAREGGLKAAGWMVDTFGHISQSPQIHCLFGIEALYVWRGVPALEPYFYWQAPDGSRLLTINLFGGYRNLYGVTQAPEVAVKRLNAEINKLRPFYPTTDIPLFDGYDLEDNPEDPLRFYDGIANLPVDAILQEATPATFANEIMQKGLPLPTLQGELNSGKYGATFPGTFSARTYLKIMARDSENLLFQVCEPLAALAWLNGRAYRAAQYEAWARALLQNAVHDCLCGVSIDQVHEKMEYSYRQVNMEMAADVEKSLGAIFAGFSPGIYAVSTNPSAADYWQAAGDELLHIQTNGVGVWPAAEQVPIKQSNQTVQSFHWQNAHYEATIGPEGVVAAGDGMLGTLVVSAEHGDTYSDELGEQLGRISPSSPMRLKEKSAQHAVVSFDGQWQGENAQATATVHVHFDQSPLLRWQIDLDTRGTDLRVEMVFSTGISGRIEAGMPFDWVQRPSSDTDLLPPGLPEALSKVLLGQRELNAVTAFPFHDLVKVANENKAVAIFAKGLRTYTAQDDGTIILPLRRAVQWLTKTELKNRVGDAGPFFYVPDARCERQVHHEIGFVFGVESMAAPALQSLNAAFHNPALIVSNKGEGAQTQWSFLWEDVPLSSLYVREDTVYARFYNPTPDERPFYQAYQQTDVWGKPTGQAAAMAPKQIMTVKLAHDPPAGEKPPNPITLLTPFRWRVGRNTGLPDPEIMADLEAKIAALAGKLAGLTPALEGAIGAERHRLQHQYYVWQREKLEFELSFLLNWRKLDDDGAMHYDYLYQPDDEIAALGLELNHLRIKRRIYDYIVASL